MTKHAAVAFDRELYDLFDARTHWLRAAVRGKPRGRPPALNRDRVSRTIECLQALASECIAEDFARRHFSELVEEKWRWHVTPSKGRGWEQKRSAFDDWFEERVTYTNCIYIFWGDTKCRYVGRTIRGRGRPRSHFEKQWFTKVRRIEIYGTSQASEIPRLECLAIHRFSPAENRVKSATVKWTKKCPVCEVHAMIRDELRRIFRLR